MKYSDNFLFKGERQFDGENLQCRFYANQYPELEEVVMVNVVDIGEMGAYVTLLEYDNAQVINYTSSEVLRFCYSKIVSRE